ncbi:hypothetical protein FRB93_013077 [Tulasnella sp. JGI-2019a]|nr:hypothetical protein FRB93_013077 [Tulasnella sp. JGI-2019a]
MDTRWRALEITLKRLLRKLAPIEKSQNQYTLVPESPITQDQWNCFLEQYANRVVNLVLNIELDETSNKLISTLLETFGGPFGSNLTSLRWTGTASGRDSYQKLIGLLHGTKLREVNLPPEDHGVLIEHSLPTSLSHLARSAPQISKLQVGGVMNSFDVSVFSRLRSLSHSRQLSASNYHNLTHCVHLQALCLYHAEVQVTSRRSMNGANTKFPRLEKFQLYDPTDEADNMISRSEMPVLRFLEYTKAGVAGPFTMPLLNNILRTSPLLEAISFIAGVLPS